FHGDRFVEDRQKSASTRQVNDTAPVGKRHLVPHHVDRLNGTTSQLSKRGRDLLRASHLYGVQGQTEGRRGTPQRRQVVRDPVARVPVPKHRYAREAGLSISEQLQLLSRSVGRDIPRQARDVASRTSQARDQARGDWIAGAAQHNWDSPSRI